MTGRDDDPDVSGGEGEPGASGAQCEPEVTNEGGEPGVTGFSPHFGDNRAPCFTALQRSSQITQKGH